MIDEGKIVAEGCADDIRERYQVKNLDELYLKLTKGDPK